MTQTSPLDPAALRSHVERVWDDTILPNLIEYVRIPNKSPHYDPEWAEHGYMDQAVKLIEDWCRARDIEGLELEVVRLEGRTPLLYMEVPGTGDGTVLLYGHYDKQPEMTGWRKDLGPWKPVLEGDKLYGRGGAGLYADGLFFAIIENDTLRFKVDDTNLADFEEAGMGPFKPYKDKKETMKYYEVPIEVLEDDASLKEWGLKAIGVARVASKGKKKKSKKK